MDRTSKIRFTKHATEKFELLKRYGFEIKQKNVVEAILQPERLDERAFSFLRAKS